MIVSCPSCGARYRYDESRFGGKASTKIRCTKCESNFDIDNPATAGSPAAAALAPAADPHPALPPNPPPVLGNETTFTRRRDSSGEPTREQPASRPKTAPHPVALRLPGGKKLSLAVISGPDAGKTFAIDKPRVVLGRAGADIALSDAEISRSHAAVEVDGDSVTVLDLESTNGTYFGGERIESAALDHYGEFEVGGTTLMLIVTHE